MTRSPDTSTRRIPAPSPDAVITASVATAATGAAALFSLSL
jgi:hypothetical protein